MATISRTYGPATANPVATGSTILAAHVNTDLDTIYSDYNGNITNANIAASAAIAISKTALVTFTDWTAWTPTWGGFSANPTVTARYTQIGKFLFAYIITTANGTSNATNFTLTLPVAPVNAQRFVCWSVDNGAAVTTPSELRFTAASTTATVFKTFSGGAATWTASGEKAIYCNVSYEVS